MLAPVRFSITTMRVIDKSATMRPPIAKEIVLCALATFSRFPPEVMYWNPPTNNITKSIIPPMKSRELIPAPTMHSSCDKVGTGSVLHIYAPVYT